MLELTGRVAGRVHETDPMPRDVNQNPEQIARDRIDDRLRAAGWQVQDRNAVDFNAGLGIAVREYQTDIGPADYVLCSVVGELPRNPIRRLKSSSSRHS